MRDVSWQDIDAATVPVVSRANDYPEETVGPPHNHSRAQLLHGATGVMIVSTVHGTWVVPPAQGVWIPPRVVHQVSMLGKVSTRNIYIDRDHLLGLPEECRVVAITPLMRSLLFETADLPFDYPPDSRAAAIMTLLLHELRAMETLPLGLPFPEHARLAARCRAFLEQPSVHAAIDAWAASLSMSRRAFTRLFRHETGLSFRAWCQQACLFTALPRLNAGESVTAIALDLGYETPAAFTSMFKRALGVPPSRYMKA
ncbi:transcriptional regulator, AraC family [Arboricoccus pini]|uniref:Transcriptional regulator, AraC family n=1 Tax=Arboricoccus pini TaxID=1963835 RepID=A0A212RE46_9PROT|nr:helix-turn-helix transcriptional regulator [Arboricoccus pini]SNB70478.1 transcriptional regulator, AraC family [Arboricoccus pini]